MPWEIRKVYGKECYEVRNKITKKVKAKCTTREKAEAQLRILEQWVHKNGEKF
jgi:hypothetical protein